MKITMDPTVLSYTNTVQSGTKTKQSVPHQDTRNNFDQIMIKSNSRQIAESRMAQSAEKAVTSAVFKQTPEQKITDLREQVAQGLYRVDAEAVASKILLAKGE